jgi:hypothetical protein
VDSQTPATNKLFRGKGYVDGAVPAPNSVVAKRLRHPPKDFAEHPKHPDLSTEALRTCP